MVSKKATVHVIACAVLALDLKKAAQELGMKITTDFLPAGLHNEPTQLRQKLQAAIDEASQKGDVPANCRWDTACAEWGRLIFKPAKFRSLFLGCTTASPCF